MTNLTKPLAKLVDDAQKAGLTVIKYPGQKWIIRGKSLTSVGIVIWPDFSIMRSDVRLDLCTKMTQRDARSLLGL